MNAEPSSPALFGAHCGRAGVARQVLARFRLVDTGPRRKLGQGLYLAIAHYLSARFRGSREAERLDAAV